MDSSAPEKDGQMQIEDQPKQEEPQKLEGLKKGDKNRTVEEDKRLQEQVVSYTQFEELNDFEPDHLFKTDQEAFIMKQMKEMMGDPEDWLAMFNALNYLRIINKYHSGVLMENLEYFAPFMKASVENLRSNISKNSLMFCTEFFNNKEPLQTDKYRPGLINFMNVVLPAIFLRTVYDKVFIAKEAKNAVTNCLTNCILPEALEITIKDGCQNKINNKKLQEEAHVSFLKTLVNSSDLTNKQHHFLVDASEWSQTLITFLYIGHESNPRIKKGSVEIFKLLDSKLKEANDASLPSLEDLLKATLKKEPNQKVEEEKEADGAGAVTYDEFKVSTIMKIFKAPAKPAAVPKGKDFRKFLKQQKAQQKTDDDCVIAGGPKTGSDQADGVLVVEKKEQ